MCGIEENMLFATVLLVLLLLWSLGMTSICWIIFLLDDEGAELPDWLWAPILKLKLLETFMGRRS